MSTSRISTVFSPLFVLCPECNPFQNCSCTLGEFSLACFMLPLHQGNVLPLADFVQHLFSPGPEIAYPYLLLHSLLKHFDYSDNRNSFLLLAGKPGIGIQVRFLKLSAEGGDAVLLLLRRCGAVCLTVWLPITWEDLLGL